jgi:uncharacterized LabA/DUF88 family protein
LFSRTAIFIDGAYLDKILDTEFGRVRADFSSLSREIAPSEILRTYYYHCPPYVSPHNPTQEELQRADAKGRFFTALSRLPRFQLRLGKLMYRGEDPDGNSIFHQKLVDVKLSVDMVQMAATRQVSNVVLVAGDGDFVPAVEVAKSHGIIVGLWHGPIRNGTAGTVHRELWEVCDDRFEIGEELVSKIRRQQ